MHENQCVKHIQSQQERHQSNVSNVAMLYLFLVSLLPIQNPVKNIYDGDFLQKYWTPKSWNVWLGPKYASESWTDFTHWLSGVSIFDF